MTKGISTFLDSLPAPRVRVCMRNKIGTLHKTISRMPKEGDQEEEEE